MLGGKRKGGKNNQSRGKKKQYFSARSHDHFVSYEYDDSL